MSRKHHAHPRPAPQRPGPHRWVLTAIVAGGLVIAAAGVVLVRTAAAPGVEPTSAEHVQGDPSAPVTIVEWGDFQ